jgi:hypothetical protein
MERVETIRVVSRAVAVIQFVSAFLDITYLPERFIWLIHHSSEINGAGLASGAHFWTMYYQVEVWSLIVRISGLLLFGILFWNCGPWVERILMPQRPSNEIPKLSL